MNRPYHARAAAGAVAVYDTRLSRTGLRIPRSSTVSGRTASAVSSNHAATAGSSRSNLALDALDVATWRRKDADLSRLVRHSGRSAQHLPIRYTQCLGEAGVVASVGSRTDATAPPLCRADGGT